MTADSTRRHNVSPEQFRLDRDVSHASLQVWLESEVLYIYSTEFLSTFANKT